MADKPSSDPTWATNATPNVNEPAGQRADGYPNGFVPPAGAHNWQFQTIGEWIEWLDGSIDAYDSLNEYIEAQNLADNPLNNESINPGVVRDTRRVGFDLGANLDLGDVSAGVVCASSGRHVAIETPAGSVAIYTATDSPTLVKTLTLSQTPVGLIDAIAIDALRCYVAYVWNNGGTLTAIVESHIIDAASTLDTSWATSGVYTHDTGVSAVIRDMFVLQRRLYFTGNAAGGGGDTTATHNVVELSASGNVNQSAAPISGQGLQLSYAQNKILLRTDNAGVNVALIRPLGFSIIVWSADFDTDWTAIRASVISNEWFAIYGDYSGATDPQLHVYPIAPLNGELGPPVARDTDFVTTYDVCWLFFDKEHLFLVANDGTAAGTNGTLFVRYTINQKTEMASAYVDGDGAATPNFQSGRGGLVSVTGGGTGIYNVAFATEMQPGLPNAAIEMQCVATVSGSVARYATATFVPGSDYIQLRVWDDADPAVLTNAGVAVHATWERSELHRDWEATVYPNAADPYVAATGFDGWRLWTLLVDIDGVDSEFLVSRTLGYGPRWWMASDRDDDLTTHGALPLD